LHHLRKSIDSAPLPILKQADGYRARKAGKDMLKAAETAVRNTAVALEQSAVVIEEQLESAPLDTPPPTRLPSLHQAGQRVLELDVRGRTWVVSIDLTTDPAATQWVQLTDKKPIGRGDRELGIRLGLSHPFTQRFGGANNEQMEALVRMAAGVAIAEVTARESGVKEAGTIRRNLNELLLDALSRG
jgi:hypothetical protein